MTLPARRPDPYANVDIHAYGTAANMTREQLQLIANIAESRRDFESSSMWKSILMDGVMVEAEQKNRQQAAGVPLRGQAPAPAVPASPTTFDRKVPANRTFVEPETAPEPSVGDAREWSRDGSRANPGRATAAQNRRNEQLLADQIRSMR